MASDFDLKPHERMWHDFTKLFMYSTAGLVVLLVVLALTLL